MLPQHIETSADRLVHLVHDRKRISLQDAARALGVGVISVQEVAAFLEEAGLIGLEYKFHKTFLIERQLKPHEVPAKVKQLAEQKDIFIHEVDNTLSRIERDALTFAGLKQEFKQLEADLGGDIEKVKGQIQDLARFGTFERAFDKKLQIQEEALRLMVERSNKQIDAVNHRHEQVLASIEKTRRSIAEDQADLTKAQAERDSLKLKLTQITGAIEAMNARLGRDDEKLGRSLKLLKTLETLAGSIEKDATRRKDSLIEPLMRLTKEHERKMRDMHAEIQGQSRDVKQLVKRQSRAGEAVSKQFVKFFDKRIQVQALLERIGASQDDLKRSLVVLKKKALALSISAKSLTAPELAMLEQHLKTIDVQRTWLQEEISKLSSLLKQ